ncbi:SRPBCC family protein [soil metagenome]
MALTVQPFAENKALDNVRSALDLNVTSPERVGSTVAGAGLLLYGISRKSLPGLLLAVLGGALLRRGITGHCEMYQRLGVNSRQLNSESGVRGDRGIKVTKSIVVSRPPQEVYRYWRKLENLAQFMEHLKSVKELDDRRSQWVVKGPLGHDVEWTAHIITDRENEMIAWESLPGAEVQNAGSVWFERCNDGVSTEVKVSLQYLPPAGVVGAVVAKFFGEAPEQQLNEDLGRFKKLLETGQVEAIAAAASNGVAN